MRRLINPLLLPLLLALAPSACFGGGNEPTEVAQPETEVAEVVEAEPTEEPAPEATAAPAEEAVVEPTADPADEPVEEVADIGPPPAFTESLKATDPTNIVLGQGKPQLVEFFAFW